jgi:acid stress-induced BolA-like protein IbaG/YrbA
MAERQRRGRRDQYARAEGWNLEGDGVDPKVDALRERAEARRASRERSMVRDASLAKIVARVVEAEVCGIGAAIDAGLSVVHAEVSAGGAHVRVLLASRRGAVVVCTEWLARAKTRARTALARELARKRVPSVELRVISPAEWEGGVR